MELLLVTLTYRTSFLEAVGMLIGIAIWFIAITTMIAGFFMGAGPAFANGHYKVFVMIVLLELTTGAILYFSNDNARLLWWLLVPFAGFIWTVSQFEKENIK